VDALDFAHEHGSFVSLCSLAYKIGPSTYKKYIIDNVQRWRDQGFLQIAIEAIYREERALIQERQQQKLGGNLATPYRGLQIFDIFEPYFPEELGQFLKAHNKKLYCLFTLRNGRGEEANELMPQVI
jgi:hypothetical protein